MNNKLTDLKIEDLDVGDIVGIKQYINCGWSRKFRYPIVTKYEVVRITPKKTKAVLQKCKSSKNVQIGLNKSEVSNFICVYDEVAEYQNKYAIIFEKVDSLKYNLSNSPLLTLDKLEDEDLTKVRDLLQYLYDKYVKEKP